MSDKYSSHASRQLAVRATCVLIIVLILISLCYLVDHHCSCNGDYCSICLLSLSTRLGVLLFAAVSLLVFSSFILSRAFEKQNRRRETLVLLKRKLLI